jgi:hypothetical protein
MMGLVQTLYQGFNHQINVLSAGWMEAAVLGPNGDGAWMLLEAASEEQEEKVLSCFAALRVAGDEWMKGRLVG